MFSIVYMKKARFKTLEEQMAFFNSVKKKLGVGAKKLAETLGLKSRGSIESYTFGRTAPPLEIVKKLEKLSDIKGNYVIVEGRVVRKRRSFLPMNPIEAEQNLKKRFDKDFIKIDGWIKSDLSIKNIVNKIREKGYSFDGSLVSKCVGAYRTNLKINIVEYIHLKDNDIVISGFVRKEKGTNSISFNLINLHNILKEKKIRIGLEFSKDRKYARIFPLKYGRTLHPSNNAIKILVTKQSGIEPGSKINIILNPKQFGFSIYDSIFDNDGKPLARELIKNGFIFDQYRSTPANHKGDLSVFLNGKNYIIEITRAKSYKSSYFKVGQCYVQKISYPEAAQVLICNSSFLLPSTRKAFKEMKVEILETNFEEKWEKKIAQKMIDLT